MGQDQLNDLLTQYLNGTIDKGELLRLLGLIADKDILEIDPIIDQLLQANFQPDQQSGHFDSDAVLRRIRLRTNEQKEPQGADSTKRTGRRIRMYWAAASIMGFLIILSVLFNQNSKSTSTDKALASSDIFLSAENQVVLYLVDGSFHDLTRANPETLRDIGVDVTIDENGERLFILTPSRKKSDGYRIIKNGKGNVCQLQLTDGSHVWLNADATLSYPGQFTESKRQVGIEGEAFFEVSHDEHRPFEVSTANTVIRVLGTQFNIANDRSSGITRTTLVEGSVKVSREHHAVVLHPGWQATTDEIAKGISTDTVDLRDVTAWKEGYFRFNDHTIEEVMAQLAAWYNIKHVYLEEQTQDRFTGSITRGQKLSEVLVQLAEISNYRFKIKEGSVYIMK